MGVVGDTTPSGSKGRSQAGRRAIYPSSLVVVSISPLPVLECRGVLSSPAQPNSETGVFQAAPTASRSRGHPPMWTTWRASAASYSFHFAPLGLAPPLARCLDLHPGDHARFRPPFLPVGGCWGALERHSPATRHRCVAASDALPAAHRSVVVRPVASTRRAESCPTAGTSGQQVRNASLGSSVSWATIGTRSGDGIVRCGRRAIRARSSRRAFGDCQLAAHLGSSVGPSGGSRSRERIAVDALPVAQIALVMDVEMRLGSWVVAGSAFRWYLVWITLVAVVAVRTSVGVAAGHMAVGLVERQAVVMTE
jgi:hypothetical protein